MIVVDRERFRLELALAGQVTGCGKDNFDWAAAVWR